ncbi:HAMP domain-containing protein [Roseovarius aestuariivivens]|uniref:HAMP domain-containing protein n=1 Tax=Roseovarius aestuariivivens TaxID=1888910 RepID=UPI001080CF58|nr:methyl-accepting chemotaxis protein [Roseovarius aestuariivivens]
MIDQNSAAIGRFDKSFLVHMIKDFFLILVLVTIVEFSIKAALVYTNYATNGETEAGRVAGELSDNVRSIMRNEGGPVAARTMYPILETNWNDLGYEIAIVPAPVTIDSIEENFGFTPEGIPAGPWPEGRYKSFSEDIVAEPFCLACHTAADVGDVLGTVTVRNYLAKDFVLWFKDIQLSGGLAIGKILVHSVLLFLILRARMEPLIGLRAVVANLARAYGGLHHRAEIRTADEFGALARDLNQFLDRISRVIGELDVVLGRVVTVNDDIVRVQGDLRDRIDSVIGRLRKLERGAMVSAKGEPRLSQRWFEAARLSLQSRQEQDRDPDATAALLDELQEVIASAEAQIRNSEALFTDLADLGEESETLRDAMAEMTRLEERLKGIIETGTTLVQRVRPDASHVNSDAETPEKA